MNNTYQVALAEAFLVRHGALHRKNLTDLLGCSQPQATKIIRSLSQEQPQLMTYSVRRRSWVISSQGKRFDSELSAQNYIDACLVVFGFDDKQGGQHASA